MKQFGSFTLDTLNECLWQAGVRIALPPKPFAVLRYLVENPGRLVSHDELLDALWPETYVQPQVLRTYMLDLRKVLDDDPRNPRFIQSLPKRGYCFIAAVSDAPKGGHSAADAIAPAQGRVLESFPHPQGPRHLIGRERELATLHGSFSQCLSGTRQTVFVTGEAGIGKTALIDVFREQIENGQMAIAALGQCISGFAAKQDYYPIADAVRQISDPSAATLGRILHHGAPADSVERGVAHGFSLLPGDLCAALEEIAREKPLVLILEDLQWADESTLNVITALARRRGPAKLMMVATLSPQCGSTPDAVTRLIHDLHMRRLCCELSLSRLAKPFVADLIRNRLQQQELPHGLHEYVHQRSEGNPRFALSLLEHLISDDLLIRKRDDDGASWQLRCPPAEIEAAAPADIARGIESEIQHLTPRERQLLEAASIVPVASPAWMIAAALNEDLATTEEACDDLARRLWLFKCAGQDELPDGTSSAFYVFAHALFREVLYQRQSSARRAVRHARVAQRLREIFRNREDLIALEAAVHYEAAADWKNAIEMLRAAAQRAVGLHAYAEAEELQRRILAIAGNMPHGNLSSAGFDSCEDRLPPSRPTMQ